LEKKYLFDDEKDDEKKEPIHTMSVAGFSILIPPVQSILILSGAVR